MNRKEIRKFSTLAIKIYKILLILDKINRINTSKEQYNLMSASRIMLEYSLKKLKEIL